MHSSKKIDNSHLNRAYPQFIKDNNVYVFGIIYIDWLSQVYESSHNLATLRSPLTNLSLIITVKFKLITHFHIYIYIGRKFIFIYIYIYMYMLSHSLISYSYIVFQTPYSTLFNMPYIIPYFFFSFFIHSLSLQDFQSQPRRTHNQNNISLYIKTVTQDHAIIHTPFF